MKAKRFFTLFIGLALTPLILAYLILKSGWFSAGATAKGEFLNTEVSIEQLNAPPHWHLVFQPSEPCLQVCQEQVYAVQQIHTALGKKQHKLKTKVLSNAEHELYRQIETVPAHLSELSAEFLYLVDPFGKVILRYEIQGERQQTVVTSKKVLADLKKLLNYSRMG